MKILESAPRQDFDIYIAKSGTQWCERETTDTLAELYASGYLPYSGAQGLQNIFYRARSARVMLADFALTSENRRIAKKFDGQFVKERLQMADFRADEDFYAFCLSYFAAKHGERAMPRGRLETILQSGLVSTVVRYSKDSTPVAYVLEVADGDMAHYWFSFYDMAYARQSLGVWLMLDALRQAQADSKKYYYLGTVYGEKAFYKTNFSPLQWWNGESWSDDIRLLKSLA